MTGCHLGLGTKRCPKIWTKVATAIGLSEKPSSTCMWIKHIRSAASLLYLLIMYIKRKTTTHTVWKQPTWPKTTSVVYGSAQGSDRYTPCPSCSRNTDRKILICWRTWWGVCSEDWELNNVEEQHTYTHIYTHTQWWCVSASPCCSRCSQAERSRPSAQQHRENSSARRQRGTRLTDWLHFFCLLWEEMEWETDTDTESAKIEMGF